MLWDIWDRFRVLILIVAGVVVVVAAFFLIKGCFGGEGDESDLVDRLPADTVTASYVDLEALREQLGLPEDADPSEVDITDQSDESQDLLQLQGAVAMVLQNLSVPGSEDPINAALDGGQITAAARGNGTGTAEEPPVTLTVIKTDQSFDDIAAGLEDEGFEEKDSVLESEEAPTYNVVADAGDGVVVLGDERDAVETAVADEGEAPAVADLLDEVEGAQRTATVFEDSECVTSIVTGADADPLEGEMVLNVDGEADEDNFDDAATVGFGIELEDPEFDGDTVRVAFTAGEEAQAPGVLGGLLASVGPLNLYRCEGDAAPAIPGAPVPEAEAEGEPPATTPPEDEAPKPESESE